VLVYLQKDRAAQDTLVCSHLILAAGRRDTERTSLREFGVGAQILKDLGLSRLRLLTDNPKKIVGLESYGLEVVEQLPLFEAGARPRVAARRPRR
jgi:3,4-dihydroxy 2-butanone 4-phosphate synthase/GTP cyclohydrolase II